MTEGRGRRAGRVLQRGVQWAAVWAVGVVLAACGGGSGGSPASGAPATPAAVVAPALTIMAPATAVEPGAPLADSKTSTAGSIAYGNNVYVAIADNSFAVSTDGMHWSPPAAGIDGHFSQVMWYQSRFVAIGAAGLTATSTDGRVWRVNRLATDQDLRQLRVVDGGVVAIGVPRATATDRRSAVVTSADGLNWSIQFANLVTDDIVIGGAVRLTVPQEWSGTGSAILRSTDGLEWRPTDLPPMTEAPAGTQYRIVTKLAYGGGQFVALVQYRDALAGMVGYAIWRSVDGAVWKTHSAGATPDRQARLNAVTYADGQFVVVGSGGLIATSRDGIDWVQRPPATNAPLYAVMFARGLWVASGGGGALVLSQDAATWRAVATDVTNGLFELRHTGTAFYALMSGEAPYSAAGYEIGYGVNPRRTTANLVSLDARRWFGGPAAAGVTWESQRDTAPVPVPALPGDAPSLPQAGAMAADAQGNLFVGDAERGIILKLAPDGASSVFAGRSGVRGTADGKRDAAQFTNPGALAVDGAGNVYVADGAYVTDAPLRLTQMRAALRKITPDGTVTTLAGSPESGASLVLEVRDGSGTAARFGTVTGLTVGPSGTVYVADSGTVRTVTPAGMVTTLAGMAGVGGSTDGTGSAARFSDMRGLYSDAADNLVGLSAAGVPPTYVVRRISPSGVVTTGAMLTNTLVATAFDRSTGTLYAADGTTLWRVGPDGHVTDTGVTGTGLAQWGVGSMSVVAPNKVAVLANGVLRFVMVPN